MPPLFSRHERALQPPGADFAAIAENAVRHDIFSVDPATVEHNRTSTTKLPTHMLDEPYSGNSIYNIEINGQDVPVASMGAVRKNIATASRLLAPSEQVGLYFHGRFTTDFSFDSPKLNEIVQSYRPSTPSPMEKAKDSQFSFQPEVPERKTYDRSLFTKEETLAALALTKEQPEVALTVLTYRVVMQDYFARLKQEFVQLASQPDSGVRHEDPQKLDPYIENWDTSNFTSELIPAISLLSRREDGTHAPVTQETFEAAAEFIIKNGAFRNWVTVPAHVAEDGVERVNHFLCPALSAIKQQLSNGQILGRIHGIIQERSQAGDLAITTHLETIRTNANKAEQKYEAYEAERAKTPEDHRREFEEKLRVPVIIEDTPRAIRVDPGTLGFFEQERQPGDVFVDRSLYTSYVEVLRAAANIIATDGTPVCFTFNKVPYRVTKDKIRALYELQNQPPKQS